eukprot:749795-Hanusia_phi.AAC.8
MLAQVLLKTKKERGIFLDYLSIIGVRCNLAFDSLTMLASGLLSMAGLHFQSQTSETKFVSVVEISRANNSYDSEIIWMLNCCHWLMVSRQIQEIFFVYSNEIQKCIGLGQIDSETQTKLAEHKAVIYADVDLLPNRTQNSGAGAVNLDQSEENNDIRKKLRARKPRSEPSNENARLSPLVKKQNEESKESKVENQNKGPLPTDKDSKSINGSEPGNHVPCLPKTGREKMSRSLKEQMQISVSKVLSCGAAASFKQHVVNAEIQDEVRKQLLQHLDSLPDIPEQLSFTSSEIDTILGFRDHVLERWRAIRDLRFVLLLEALTTFSMIVSVPSCKGEEKERLLPAGEILREHPDRYSSGMSIEVDPIELCGMRTDVDLFLAPPPPHTPPPRTPPSHTPHSKAETEDVIEEEEDFEENKNEKKESQEVSFSDDCLQNLSQHRSVLRKYSCNFLQTWAEGPRRFKSLSALSQYFEKNGTHRIIFDDGDQQDIVLPDPDVRIAEMYYKGSYNLANEAMTEVRESHNFALGDIVWWQFVKVDSLIRVPRHLTLAQERGRGAEEGTDETARLLRKKVSPTKTVCWCLPAKSLFLLTRSFKVFTFGDHTFAWVDLPAEELQAVCLYVETDTGFQDLLGFGLHAEFMNQMVSDMERFEISVKEALFAWQKFSPDVRHEQRQMGRVVNCFPGRFPIEYLQTKLKRLGVGLTESQRCEIATDKIGIVQGHVKKSVKKESASDVQVKSVELRPQDQYALQDIRIARDMAEKQHRLATSRCKYNLSQLPPLLTRLPPAALAFSFITICHQGPDQGIEKKRRLVSCDEERVHVLTVLSDSYKETLRRWKMDQLVLWDTQKTCGMEVKADEFNHFIPSSPRTPPRPQEPALLLPLVVLVLLPQSSRSRALVASSPPLSSSSPAATATLRVSVTARAVTVV